MVLLAHACCSSCFAPSCSGKEERSEEGEERKREERKQNKKNDDVGPFFFAIVTTLRVLEVETAGDREGAAIVMRAPQREDLRTDAMAVVGGAKRERSKKKEKE